MSGSVRTDEDISLAEAGASGEMADSQDPDIGGSELPPQLRYLPERERAQRMDLRGLFAEQEHELRQKYAEWILWLLGAQFLVADAVFVTFAWAGWGWELTPGVIEVWLAATVVQVLGVVAVVTRHLFPNRDGEEVRAV
jgi:glutathione S-transferase